MYYKPTKFNQNRFSHFLRKSKFNFFLCELPLVLGVGGKLKKARDICERTLDIDFESDWLIRSATDRQTDKHTQTFFKTLF